MARHNREATGTDQSGVEYVIGYQPDWLHQVKVTRELETGRQSTKTLFRNACNPEQDPGTRVRTRLASPQTGLDVEVTLDDPRGVVRRIIVETVLPDGRTTTEVAFSIDHRVVRRSGT